MKHTALSLTQKPLVGEELAAGSRNMCKGWVLVSTNADAKCCCSDKMKLVVEGMGNLLTAELRGADVDSVPCTLST